MVEQLVDNQLDKYRLSTSNVNINSEKFIRVDESRPHPLRSLTYCSEQVREYNVQRARVYSGH